MARPLQYAGACYHVINRGNRREVVFHDGGDGELFIEKYLKHDLSDLGSIYLLLFPLTQPASVLLFLKKS